MLGPRLALYFTGFPVVGRTSTETARCTTCALVTTHLVGCGAGRLALDQGRDAGVGRPGWEDLHMSESTWFSTVGSMVIAKRVFLAFLQDFF